MGLWRMTPLQTLAFGRLWGRRRIRQLQTLDSTPRRSRTLRSCDVRALSWWLVRYPATPTACSDELTRCWGLSFTDHGLPEGQIHCGTRVGEALPTKDTTRPAHRVRDCSLQGLQMTAPVCAIEAYDSHMHQHSHVARLLELQAHVDNQIRYDSGSVAHRNTATAVVVLRHSTTLYFRLQLNSVPPWSLVTCHCDWWWPPERDRLCSSQRFVPGATTS